MVWKHVLRNVAGTTHVWPIVCLEITREIIKKYVSVTKIQSIFRFFFLNFFIFNLNLISLYPTSNFFILILLVLETTLVVSDLDKANPPKFVKWIWTICQPKYKKSVSATAYSNHWSLIFYSKSIWTIYTVKCCSDLVYLNPW